MLYLKTILAVCNTNGIIVSGMAVEDVVSANLVHEAYIKEQLKL